MSVYVSVATSVDGPVIDVTISNVGVVQGSMENDLRRYEWRDTDGRHGVVEHRRSEGIERLVASVMSAMSETAVSR